tara:strand:+ start:1331 stop:1732 length:402 start_codon:yes stop_codon:yes gene_type:complete
MANLTITNVDLGSVILKDGEFRDDLLTFAGAATVLEGTILARDSGTLKLVPFVKGGVTNENGVPKAVVTYDVVAAGAGDESIRDMVSGSVRAERLIIDADGDGSHVDAAVLDQLRDYSLISIDVQELNILDNQ